MNPLAMGIRSASQTLGIGPDVFRRLDPKREHKVLQDIQRHFLTRIDAPRWWEAFRYAAEGAALPHADARLAELCPLLADKKMWFVPCEADVMVYDALPEAASRILGACGRFAYAAVDKKLRWLFLRDRDGVMHATGEPAIVRLREGMQCRAGGGR